MKTRCHIATLLALVAALAQAQSKPSPLVGAWRVVEVTMTGPNGSTISSPQPGLMLFTEKYYSIMRVEGDHPRPELPRDQSKATAADFRAVWDPLNAHSGAYEIYGDKITMRRIVTKNPIAMRPGNYAVYSFKITGDTLVITDVRVTGSPAVNPTTVKLTRLE